MIKIVISGVNLVEGGPLKVFKDIIQAFTLYSERKLDIYCLVNNAALFDDLVSNKNKLTFIEYPNIKKSWLKRIFFEYITCKNISLELKPDIWLSMHDITPNVITRKQFVYCHNSSPFYQASFNDLLYDPTFFIFTFAYKWLYKINIKKNKSVITQQKWFADYFLDTLGAPRAIIAKPILEQDNYESYSYKEYIHEKDHIRLFYPAFGRTFKNFELLLDSLNYLKKNAPSIYLRIHLILTINENSGRYARHLFYKYKHLDNVSFVGKLSFDEVEKQYNECDIVIFPSLLETWGLPITEAKKFGKPIILSDLPYAHETLGCYNNTLFIDPLDPITLANNFIQILNGKSIFKKIEFHETSNVVNSWDELICILIID